MERAWPFEGRDEVVESIRDPAQFLARRGPHVEAVIVRIGLNDAQLVLVDSEGGWDRWVYRSVDEAREVAEALGAPVHSGDYPENLRARMNERVRGDFGRGAYPEQGRVGPVIPYPENRPRRRGAPERGANPEAGS